MKKRIVSVTLEKPQSDFLDKIFETYGTKATDLFRSLLQKRMEDEEERQRPQINYYGSGGNYNPKISGDATIPSFIPKGKKVEEVAFMAETNSEMASIIEKTEGKPQKILRKIPKSEIKKWKKEGSLGLPREEKVIRDGNQVEVS